MDSSIICTSNDKDEHDGMGDGKDDNYGLSQVCDLFGGTCETWSSRKTSPKYRFSEPCKSSGAEVAEAVQVVGSPRPNIKSKRKPMQNRTIGCDKSEGSKPSVIESSASDSSAEGGFEEAAGCTANGFGAICMTGRSAEAIRFQEEQQRKQKIRELSHTNKALLERMQQLQEEADRQRASQIVPDVDDEPRIKEKLSAASSESNKSTRSLLDNDESILDLQGSSPLECEQSKLQAVETLNRDLQDELRALKKVVEGQRNVKQDLNDVRGRYKSMKTRNKEVEAQLIELKDSMATCTEENDFLSKKLSYLEKRKVGEVDLPNLINRDTATRAIIVDLKHEIHNLKCEVAVERILKQRYKGELQRSCGDESDEAGFRNLFQSEDDIRCEILGEQRKLRQEHSFIASKFQENLETIAEHYWREEGLLRYEIDSLHTFMHEKGMEPFSITESLFDEGQFLAKLQNVKDRNISPLWSAVEAEGQQNDEAATGEACLGAGRVPERIDSRGLFPDEESDAEEDFGPIAAANDKIAQDGAQPTECQFLRERASNGLRKSEEMNASDDANTADNAHARGGNDLKLGSFSAALAGIAVVGAALSARQVDDQDGLADGAESLSIRSLDRCGGDALNGKEADPCTTGRLSSCTPQAPCPESDHVPSKKLQGIENSPEIAVAETPGESEEHVVTVESSTSYAANASCDSTRTMRTVELEFPIPTRPSSEPMSTIDPQWDQETDESEASGRFLDGQQRGVSCETEHQEPQNTGTTLASTTPSSAAVLSDLLEAEAAQALREDQALQPRSLCRDEGSLTKPTDSAFATGAVSRSKDVAHKISSVTGIPVVVGEMCTIITVVDENDTAREPEGQADSTLLRPKESLECDPEKTSNALLGDEDDSVPIQKRVDFLSSRGDDEVRERSSVTLDDSTTSSDQSVSDGSDEETTGGLAKTFNLFTEPQKWGNSVDNSPVLLAFENYVCSGIDTADSQILSQSGVSETQGSVTSGSILSDGQPLNPMDVRAPCGVASMEDKHCSRAPLVPQIDRNSHSLLLDNEQHAKTVSDVAVDNSKVLNKSEHSTTTNGISNLGDAKRESIGQPMTVRATEVTAESSIRDMFKSNEERNFDQVAPHGKEMSISERIAMFEKTINGKESTKMQVIPRKKLSHGTGGCHEQAKHPAEADIPSVESPGCRACLPSQSPSTVAPSLGIVDEAGTSNLASQDDSMLEAIEQTCSPPETEENQCNTISELVSVTSPEPPTIESEVRAMAEDFFELKRDASSDQGSHLSTLPRREICVDGDTEKSTDPVAGDLLPSKDPFVDCVATSPDVANIQSVETNAPQTIAGDSPSADSGIIACPSSETTSEAPYCGQVAEKESAEPSEEANLVGKNIDASLDVASNDVDSSEQTKPRETSDVMLPISPLSEIKERQEIDEVQLTPPPSPTTAFSAFKSRNEHRTTEPVVDLIRIANGDGVPLLVPSLTPSFDSSNRTKSLVLETEQAKCRGFKLPTVDDSEKEDCDASSWSTISVARGIDVLASKDSAATMSNGRDFDTMKSRRKCHSKADLVALHQWGMIPESGRNSPRNEEGAATGKLVATSTDGPEGEALYEHEDFNEAMIIRTMPNPESLKSEKIPYYETMSALATKGESQMQDDVSELSQSLDGRASYRRRRTMSPDYTTSLESLPRFDDRRYDRTPDDDDWVDTMVRGFSSFWS